MSLDYFDHRALAEIAKERGHQNDKWGEQLHTYSRWMVILGEEFGEACQEVCHLEVPPTNPGEETDLDIKRKLYHELKQVAAVAAAIMRQIDRDIKP